MSQKPNCSSHANFILMTIVDSCYVIRDRKLPSSCHQGACHQACLSQSVHHIKLLLRLFRLLHSAWCQHQHWAACHFHALSMAPGWLRLVYIRGEHRVHDYILHECSILGKARLAACMPSCASAPSAELLQGTFWLETDTQMLRLRCKRFPVYIAEADQAT